MKNLSVFFCGWLFAIGLGVSGMTQPIKIIRFLDITGNFDPSLLFVMGGAVMLGLFSFAWVLRQQQPKFDERFHLPSVTKIDGKLVLGAALFGIGWGLSGFCPGPALVSAITLSFPVAVFLGFLVLGLALGRWLGHKFNQQDEEQND